MSYCACARRLAASVWLGFDCDESTRREIVATSVSTRRAWSTPARSRSSSLANPLPGRSAAVTPAAIMSSTCSRAARCVSSSSPARYRASSATALARVALSAFALVNSAAVVASTSAIFARSPWATLSPTAIRYQIHSSVLCCCSSTVPATSGA